MIKGTKFADNFVISLLSLTFFFDSDKDWIYFKK